MLKMKTLRLSTVKKIRKHTLILQHIAVAMIFIGLFLCVGNIGHIDFSVNMGHHLTPDEEHASWFRAGMSLFYSGINIGIAILCDKFVEFLDTAIAIREERIRKQKAL